MGDGLGKWMSILRLGWGGFVGGGVAVELVWGRCRRW